MRLGSYVLLMVVLGLTVTGWASQESNSATAASSVSASSAEVGNQQQQEQQLVTLEEGLSASEVFSEKPLTRREIYEGRMSMSNGPDSLGEATCWLITILLGVVVAIIGFGGGSALKRKSRLWYPVVGLLYLVGSAGVFFGLFMALGPFLADAHACWPICNHFGPL